MNGSGKANLPLVVVVDPLRPATTAKRSLGPFLAPAKSGPPPPQHLCDSDRVLPHIPRPQWGADLGAIKKMKAIVRAVVA